MDLGAKTGAFSGEPRKPDPRRVRQAPSDPRHTRKRLRCTKRVVRLDGAGLFILIRMPPMDGTTAAVTLDTHTHTCGTFSDVLFGVRPDAAHVRMQTRWVNSFEPQLEHGNMSHNGHGTHPSHSAKPYLVKTASYSRCRLRSPVREVGHTPIYGSTIIH